MLEDHFPEEALIVAADRIDDVQSVFTAKEFVLVGQYEYLAFALERMAHRPFVPADISKLGGATGMSFLSPSGEHLSLKRFIEEFTMSIVSNYMVLREEGFLVSEIKISVGSDGSLQIGEGQIGRQILFCPASIEHNDVQTEIIRCVAQACQQFETGGLDGVALIQAKARNRYVLKRAFIRRFLKNRV